MVPLVPRRKGYCFLFFLFTPDPACSRKRVKLWHSAPRPFTTFSLVAKDQGWSLGKDLKILFSCLSTHSYAPYPEGCSRLGGYGNRINSQHHNGDTNSQRLLYQQHACPLAKQSYHVLLHISTCKSISALQQKSTGEPFSLDLMLNFLNVNPRQQPKAGSFNAETILPTTEPGAMMDGKKTWPLFTLTKSDPYKKEIKANGLHKPERMAKARTPQTGCSGGGPLNEKQIFSELT